MAVRPGGENATMGTTGKRRKHSNAFYPYELAVEITHCTKREYFHEEAVVKGAYNLRCPVSRGRNH